MHEKIKIKIICTKLISMVDPFRQYIPINLGYYRLGLSLNSFIAQVE
ncbi:hypothetical protein yinte0001_30800 [Yersinia intermedia ATCC 29909]|nr:hypothetical protein yinte0001_30800 [Yersinia intermedia ATCC 29909]